MRNGTPLAGRSRTLEAKWLFGGQLVRPHTDIFVRKVEVLNSYSGHLCVFSFRPQERSWKSLSSPQKRVPDFCLSTKRWRFSQHSSSHGAWTRRKDLVWPADSCVLALLWFERCPPHRWVSAVSGGGEPNVGSQRSHRSPGEAAQHRAQSQTGGGEHDPHLRQRIHQGTACGVRLQSRYKTTLWIPKLWNRLPLKQILVFYPFFVGFGWWKLSLCSVKTAVFCVFITKQNWIWN